MRLCGWRNREACYGAARASTRLGPACWLKVGVSADAPYLDTAYKLVAYGGRPVMKLSPGKITAPGPKQVFRGPPTEGDIIAMRDEPVPAGDEPLLAPVLLGGQPTGANGDLAAARGRFEDDFGRPARHRAGPPGCPTAACAPQRAAGGLTRAGPGSAPARRSARTALIGQGGLAAWAVVEGGGASVSRCACRMSWPSRSTARW
jgi:hypothetical protein